jgi:hypothetical protein
MQAGQCDSQMGKKFSEVVCDEHGIGGGGCEYCGKGDPQLGRIDVLYHEAPGGMCVPRDVPMSKLGMIGAVNQSRRSASSSARATS